MVVSEVQKNNAMLLSLISCANAANEKVTGFTPAKNYMVKFIAYCITGKLVQLLLNNRQMQSTAGRLQEQA